MLIFNECLLQKKRQFGTCYWWVNNLGTLGNKDAILWRPDLHMCQQRIHRVDRRQAVWSLFLGILYSQGRQPPASIEGFCNPGGMEPTVRALLNSMGSLDTPCVCLCVCVCTARFDTLLWTQVWSWASHLPLLSLLSLFHSFPTLTFYD
jgi:hypothetical protein